MADHPPQAHFLLLEGVSKRNMKESNEPRAANTPTAIHEPPPRVVSLSDEEIASAQGEVF
jgi:hypothetical protein